MRRVLLAGVLAFAAPLHAQQAPGGQCAMSIEPAPQGGRVNTIEQPQADTAHKIYNIFIGGGATARCPAQNMTLVADSAEYYGATRILYLIGNVHYTEPRVTLNSERLTYWRNEEHLRAEGHVDATLPSGTNMVGPNADYYRAIAPIRATARMLATGRPTIKLVQTDSVTKQPSDTAIVLANNVAMEGDTLVYAGGKVEITRPDLVSHSDSAVMNSQRETAVLIGQPVIDGKGERPFQLSGTLVNLYGRNRQLERVLSSGNAKTISEDVTLSADTLDFRMANRLLQEAFAWGPKGKAHAHAISPTYDIVADSMWIRMPGQRLQEVHAIRNAFAQSLPDTTKIHTRERDTLRGDTVVAYFDSATVRTTTRSQAAQPQRVANAPAASTKPAAQDASDTSRPQIRRLVAIGNAKSLYHIAAKDTTTVSPSLNYVTGKTITVAFANRTVNRVTIVGLDQGVYLEPSVDTSRARGTPARPAPGRIRP